MPLLQSSELWSSDGNHFLRNSNCVHIWWIHQVENSFVRIVVARAIADNIETIPVKMNGMIFSRNSSSVLQDELNPCPILKHKDPCPIHRVCVIRSIVRRPINKIIESEGCPRKIFSKIPIFISVISF